MASPVILIALLGGLLPALLWLAFWMLEDRCEPEPKRYILLCFLLGMVCVPIALVVEQSAEALYPLGSLPLLIIWAATEEILKFSAAFLGALRTRAFDEPLDAVVYLVTAALGFSALENAMFLWGPLSQSEVLRGVITGDLRFIGASLLHTLASASIGISMALAWRYRASVRRFAALLGVILAISLHTAFNFFILGSGGGDSTFWVFLAIWLGIVALLLMVERIKQPARDYC
ncbi:MAG: PrsW family intramembrane metalloprotease [Patescibacteria group bacterium]|nr:PrsW family intramembrane metalloprotease [Patescibacteria group bacterium]